MSKPLDPNRECWGEGGRLQMHAVLPGAIFGKGHRLFLRSAHRKIGASNVKRWDIDQIDVS